MAATGNKTKAACKGQSSVELLAYWAFFFLVFIAMLTYIVIVSQDELTRRQYSLAGEHASQLGGYYDFAFRAGSGFHGSFPLPKDIMGRQYSATFYKSGNLVVEFDTPRGASQPIVQPLVSGAISNSHGGGLKDSVSLDTIRGYVNMTNSNGVIEIE